MSTPWKRPLPASDEELERWFIEAGRDEFEQLVQRFQLDDVEYDRLKANIERRIREQAGVPSVRMADADQDVTSNPEPAPFAAAITDAALQKSESEQQVLLGHYLRLLPQARDLITQWHEQPSLRLLPQVAGIGVSLDIWTPGPIYVSLLGDSGEVVWRSGLFADTDDAMVYPLSGDLEEVRAAVTFSEGRVFVDRANFPTDSRWRAFYLAQEDPAGCSEDERELFILGQASGEQSTRPEARDAVGRLVELILQGRVIEAWRGAAGQEGIGEARLEVLVSMMFCQMEVLLSAARAEVVGSLSRQDLAKPLASDLLSLPRLFDCFKQVLSEAIRERIGGGE